MFDKVTIVGVGLISGSFALAMKEKRIAKNVIGVSRTEASLKKALEEIKTSESIKLPTVATIKGLERVQQIKKIEDCVFMVKGN